MSIGGVYQDLAQFLTDICGEEGCQTVRYLAQLLHHGLMDSGVTMADAGNRRAAGSIKYPSSTLKVKIATLSACETRKVAMEIAMKKRRVSSRSRESKVAHIGRVRVYVGVGD